MGKKGIIGIILLIGGTIIQGVGTLFSITDTTEKVLGDYLNDEEEES